MSVLNADIVQNGNHVENVRIMDNGQVTENGQCSETRLVEKRGQIVQEIEPNAVNAKSELNLHKGHIVNNVYDNWDINYVTTHSHALSQSPAASCEQTGISVNAFNGYKVSKDTSQAATHTHEEAGKGAGPGMKASNGKLVKDGAVGLLLLDDDEGVQSSERAIIGSYPGSGKDSVCSCLSREEKVTEEGGVVRGDGEGEEEVVEWEGGFEEAGERLGLVTAKKIATMAAAESGNRQEQRVGDGGEHGEVGCMLPVKEKKQGGGFQEEEKKDKGAASHNGAEQGNGLKCAELQGCIKVQDVPERSHKGDNSHEVKIHPASQPHRQPDNGTNTEQRTVHSGSYCNRISQFNDAGNTHTETNENQNSGQASLAKAGQFGQFKKVPTTDYASQKEQWITQKQPHANENGNNNIHTVSYSVTQTNETCDNNSHALNGAKLADNWTENNRSTLSNCNDYSSSAHHHTGTSSNSHDNTQPGSLIGCQGSTETITLIGHHDNSEISSLDVCQQSIQSGASSSHHGCPKSPSVATAAKWSDNKSGSSDSSSHQRPESGPKVSTDAKSRLTAKETVRAFQTRAAAANFLVENVGLAAEQATKSAGDKKSCVATDGNYGGKNEQTRGVSTVENSPSSDHCAGGNETEENNKCDYRRAIKSSPNHQNPLLPHYNDSLPQYDAYVPQVHSSLQGPYLLSSEQVSQTVHQRIYDTHGAEEEMMANHFDIKTECSNDREHELFGSESASAVVCLHSAPHQQHPHPGTLPGPLTQVPSNEKKVPSNQVNCNEDTINATCLSIDTKIGFGEGRGVLSGSNDPSYQAVRPTTNELNNGEGCHANHEASLAVHMNNTTRAIRKTNTTQQACSNEILLESVTSPDEKLKIAVSQVRPHISDFNGTSSVRGYKVTSNQINCDTRPPEAAIAVDSMRIHGYRHARDTPDPLRVEKSASSPCNHDKTISRDPTSHCTHGQVRDEEVSASLLQEMQENYCSCSERSFFAPKPRQNTQNINAVFSGGNDAAFDVPVLSNTSSQMADDLTETLVRKTASDLTTEQGCSDGSEGRGREERGCSVPRNDEVNVERRGNELDGNNTMDMCRDQELFRVAKPVEPRSAVGGREHKLFHVDEINGCGKPTVNCGESQQESRFVTTDRVRGHNCHESHGKDGYATARHPELDSLPGVSETAAVVTNGDANQQWVSEYTLSSLGNGDQICIRQVPGCHDKTRTTKSITEENKPAPHNELPTLMGYIYAPDHSTQAKASCNDRAFAVMTHQYNDTASLGQGIFVRKAQDTDLLPVKNKCLSPVISESCLSCDDKLEQHTNNGKGAGPSLECTGRGENPSSQSGNNTQGGEGRTGNIPQGIHDGSYDEKSGGEPVNYGKYQPRNEGLGSCKSLACKESCVCVNRTKNVDNSLGNREGGIQGPPSECSPQFKEFLSSKHGSIKHNQATLLTRQYHKQGVSDNGESGESVEGEDSCQHHCSIKRESHARTPHLTSLTLNNSDITHNVNAPHLTKCNRQYSDYSKNIENTADTDVGGNCDDENVTNIVNSDKNCILTDNDESFVNLENSTTHDTLTDKNSDIPDSTQTSVNCSLSNSDYQNNNNEESKLMNNGLPLSDIDSKVNDFVLINSRIESLNDNAHYSVSSANSTDTELCDSETPNYSDGDLSNEEGPRDLLDQSKRFLLRKLRTWRERANPTTQERRYPPPHVYFLSRGHDPESPDEKGHDPIVRIAESRSLDTLKEQTLSETLHEKTKTEDKNNNSKSSSGRIKSSLSQSFSPRSNRKLKNSVSRTLPKTDKDISGSINGEKSWSPSVASSITARLAEFFGISNVSSSTDNVTKVTDPGINNTDNITCYDHLTYERRTDYAITNQNERNNHVSEHHLTPRCSPEVGGSGVVAWGSTCEVGTWRLRQPARLYGEEFVHVSTWFEQYGCDPCSRTERLHVPPEYRSEEPAQTNMDISTGHIVLTYMEDHLANKARLDEEWEGLVSYEAEPNLTNVAEEAANARKNRYQDILPYDHSRVVLNAETNVSGSDYINASSITDHDPRNPAYIATQGPLPHTVADFWQMVWEQGCVVIVNLTNLAEDSTALCHRYWPEEGSDLYHIYEVHLVSEHIWCEDYLVRSFYLKNLQTNETRTVTQFHFTSWPDLGVPTNIKVLLDFRRKVNKSFRGRSCPIVIHCSDGCGRTGTYCLIDMVLSRMNKGAKEIDIAATLEHILDQRMRMVKTKAQFELALSCVAEEVTSILKALPQS